MPAPGDIASTECCTSDRYAPCRHQVVSLLEAKGRVAVRKTNRLTIASVPTIVFFLIFQRNIMAGLTSGGPRSR